MGACHVCMGLNPKVQDTEILEQDIENLQILEHEFNKFRILHQLFYKVPKAR